MEKKCHLKNDNMFYFIIFKCWKSYSNCVSWEKKLIRPHVLKHELMVAAFTVLIFVYTQRKKAWINFFKLFNY